MPRGPSLLFPSARLVHPLPDPGQRFLTPSIMTSTATSHMLMHDWTLSLDAEDVDDPANTRCLTSTH